MLLDVSFSNLFLENFGSPVSSLINIFNLVIFEDNFAAFNYLNNYILLLNLWCSVEQMSEISNEIIFLSSLFGNYFDSLKHVYEFNPCYYSMDYLHLYYTKKAFYTIVISAFSGDNSGILKIVTLNLRLDIVFSQFTNKWGYFVFVLLVTYFFSNIVRFRFQYGFNFYFSYFKTLADLGEQEYGSYDDFKFFLFFLVQIFIWYCWVFFIGYTFSVQSQSTLVLLTISVMLTILCIPVRLLWDFGLSFGMYVRGAGSSSNLVVEGFFDIIGVIIIFTRFIVQNIRFLLVFVAFFELFEWTATDSSLRYILQIDLGALSDRSNHMFSDVTSFYTCIVLSIKISFIYLYHLLHLIIVSFMQIGVYLMVSFWLFFFLYTSFFRITVDSYFSYKRN